MTPSAAPGAQVSRPRRGIASPVAIRRGEGAQRKRCRDPRCSPRGNPACRGTFGPLGGAVCRQHEQDPAQGSGSWVFAFLYLIVRDLPQVRMPAVIFSPLQLVGGGEDLLEETGVCPGASTAAKVRRASLSLSGTVQPVKGSWVSLSTGRLCCSGYSRRG